MNDYPKYQYSLFVGTKGQIVIRTDDEEEFKALKQRIDYTYNENQPSSTPVTTPASLCPIHNIVYDKSGTKKDGTKWYGHATEIQGKLCFKK